MVKRHLAGLIVAAVVVGSGAVAIAAPGDGGAAGANRPPKEQVQACREAQKAGQEPSAECQQLRRRAAARRPRPGQVALAHSIHGDLIVKKKDGGFETITFDKGTVEAKGASSLTLKREDGRTVTVRVNDDTSYKGVENLEAVEVGKPAMVVHKDGTARHVAQRAPGGNNPNGGNVGTDEEQVPAT